MKKICTLALTSLFVLQTILFSQTVDEKIASIEAGGLGISGGEDFVKTVNAALATQRRKLHELSEQAALLSQSNANEDEFKNLLAAVRGARKSIENLEIQWRDAVINESKQDEEGYALWDQEETTLTQLIMEYGALDYLFIIPPEMASLKINIHSGIPIPRESWGDMLEIVLNHNGIGIKKLNPYARQLYIFKQDLSAVQVIASSLEPLYLAPSTARVFYVFSPPVEQLKSTTQFFERFSDARQTCVYQIGGKVALVASRDDVLRLVDLYQTVWKDGQGKVTRVITVNKINVKEMEKILQGFFGETLDKTGRPPFGKTDQDSLTIFSLGSGNAIVLIGSQESVDRAEKIIHSTEDQLLDPSEITVYLYTCRHSDPTDLGKVLEKVYNSLLMVSPEPSKETDINYQTKVVGPNSPPDGYQPTPPLMIGPKPINSGTISQVDIEQGTDHFIPDPKTGTLLMVVRRDALSKIKDLLRQLDVPKKMVQIEVLLFEKRLNTQNNFGLNFLKLGSDPNKIQYTGIYAPAGKGVLEFLFSGGASKHFPAFDITYSFLMTQEDVQLNAAPSVTTVNQTPATISIQEEISINNGAAPIDTNKGIAFEKSFARAQYGITIMLTPIIHAPDHQSDEDQTGFITLQTNITFDTTKPHPDDRPLVERRHIENEVRVVDGQTVIIGGLRRRTLRDDQDQVPFFGEIPILGRLFGSTKLTDHNTEMFFFITPRIISEPREQMEQLKIEELKKRPGDIPEFLACVLQAREQEQKRFFANSLKVFLSGH